jgi:hypothetical protein
MSLPTSSQDLGYRLLLNGYGIQERLDLTFKVVNPSKELVAINTGAYIFQPIQRAT